MFWIKIFLDPNVFGPKFLLDLSYESSYSIHIPGWFKTYEREFGKKICITILGKNFFAPKYFWTQISFRHLLWFTKHTCSKHILDRFSTDSNFLRNFFVSKCVGPKFLLGLGYDSQNIYAQNTFLIDSQQINKSLDFFWESLIFSLSGMLPDKTNNSETELDLDLNHIQDISLTIKF